MQINGNPAGFCFFIPTGIYAGENREIPAGHSSCGGNTPTLQSSLFWDNRAGRNQPEERQTKHHVPPATLCPLPQDKNRSVEPSFPQMEKPLLKFRNDLFHHRFGSFGLNIGSLLENEQGKEVCKGRVGNLINLDSNSWNSRCKIG